jgi:hypothetical protein
MGTKPWKAMVRKMTDDRVRVSAFEESVPSPSQQFATAEPDLPDFRSRIHHQNSDRDKAAARNHGAYLLDDGAPVHVSNQT